MLQPPFCSDHRIPMLWGETEFSYVEGGIEVTVRHIPAWTCPHGDDAAFPPGVTDELLHTIRQLLRVAKQAKADHLTWPQQEYLVKMAA